MERRVLFRAIAAVGVASLPALPGSALAQPLPQRRTPMSDSNEAVVRYLAAWNEPEPKRHRELVAKAWTEAAPTSTRAGRKWPRQPRRHDPATAQSHFPGYRLRLHVTSCYRRTYGGDP